MPFSRIVTVFGVSNITLIGAKVFGRNISCVEIAMCSDSKSAPVVRGRGRVVQVRIGA